MLRALLCVALTLLAPSLASAQAQGTLRISVTLLDSGQAPVPVPRHALLISDNPATAPPRRVVTASDGTVEVRLRPGSYTVESDQPVAFAGRAYEWTKTVDVPASGVTTLVLNAANADAADVSAAAGDSPAPRASDPSMTLQQWRGSVAAVWTPTSRVSAFVFDNRGLLATSRRALGDATTVDVQLSADTKVAGRVIVSDATRDVAVVWINPATASAIRPVPLRCDDRGKPPVEGDELFALGVPLRPEQDSLSSGEVKKADAQALAADLRLAAGGVGGPVFSESADLVGISSLPADPDERRQFPVVRIDNACAALASAEQAMKAGAPPDGTRLPVDPTTTFPPAALKAMASKRLGSLNPYPMPASDFDVGFITPVMVYAAQQPLSERRTTSEDTHRSPLEEIRATRQMDFANWSAYVADYPAVLLVRVTPKVTEGFLRTLARGAAMTQGIPLPPMGQAKARLSRLRAFCGDTEVLPIHALTIRTPVSDKESFDEGLYVFAPGALRPGCGQVKLTLYTQKDPEKGDTRTVDPAVLSRIEQDFAVLEQKR